MPTDKALRRGADLANDAFSARRRKNTPQVEIHISEAQLTALLARAYDLGRTDVPIPAPVSKPTPTPKASSLWPPRILPLAILKVTIRPPTPEMSNELADAALTTLENAFPLDTIAQFVRQEILADHEPLKDFNVTVEFDC